MKTYGRVYKAWDTQENRNVTITVCDSGIFIREEGDAFAPGSKVEFGEMNKDRYTNWVFTGFVW